MQNNSLNASIFFFFEKDLIKHIHSSAVALTEPTQFQDFCYFILLSSYYKGTFSREKRYMCYIKIGCDSEAEFFWASHSDGVYAIICYENKTFSDLNVVVGTSQPYFVPLVRNLEMCKKISGWMESYLSKRED